MMIIITNALHHYLTCQASLGIYAYTAIGIF